MAGVKSSDRKISTWLTIILGLLALVGILIRYGTIDLCNRVVRAEERIVILQRDIQNKANLSEISLMIQNIEGKIVSIEATQRRIEQVLLKNNGN